MVKRARRFSQDLRPSIIELTDGPAKMTVQEDGTGFKAPTLTKHPAATGQLGLTGMHERARLLGGTLIVDSEPGRGTRMTVNVPI